jgi:hypothetical protein
LKNLEMGFMRWAPWVAGFSNTQESYQWSGGGVKPPYNKLVGGWG